MMRVDWLCFLLVLSSLGCSATITLKPDNDLNAEHNSPIVIEGEILETEDGEMHVRLDDGLTIQKVPVQMIEDIDHPGNGMAVTGALMQIVGILLVVDFVGEEDKLDALPSLVFAAMLTSTGAILGVSGIVVWISSRAASDYWSPDKDFSQTLSAPSSQGIQATYRF